MSGPDGPGAIDVAAVDDHPVILDGVAAWLNEPGNGIRVVAAAATVAALLAGPGAAGARGAARPGPR